MSKTEVREAQRQLWKERLEAFHASGQSANQWCRDHNIPVHQLRYRLRRATVEHSRSAARQSHSWVALTEPSSESAPPSTGIVLRYGSLAIELQKGFDAQALSEVVRSLLQTC